MVVEFNTSEKGLFTHRGVYVVELIFIIASTIEIILKLIADGMILALNGLIKDVADVIHLLIYVFSLVYVLWQPKMIPKYSLAYWLVFLDDFYFYCRVLS